MPTYYLDYENGNDAADGSTFALGGLPSVGPWKTLTTGATAARIAPADIIRIAKSPAPVSIGNGTWTNLSKTVTLATAQTLTIDLCETAWTANGSGDATVTRTAVATDAKEGSYCMKIALDAAVQTSIMQAYYTIASADFSGYQKISFWIKNEAAIVANNWQVALCSDTAGATSVDVFDIPAIPSTARWVPLTIARNGGGNLGASIQSIALYSGSSNTGMASKYIYVDDFIACTTSGLNLQSLISKNSAEQGGTEGWYGIQSINGTTVLLDNDTNTKANAGEGYSTTGTTPETVTTYQRETIKTAMAVASSTVIQDVMDSGTLAGGNIQFQGGYDTSSVLQTGETFFDGLNGLGYGVRLNSKSFITLNYLNMIRYNTGIFNTGSNNTTITTLSNANNNANNGLYIAGNNNTITTLSNANNNASNGLYIAGNNNTITTLSNANNNISYGVYFSGINNTITTLSNANNNTTYGVSCIVAGNNITTLNTTGNSTAGINQTVGWINVGTATIAESTKVSGFTTFADGKVFIQSIGGFANIWCEYGNIVSQNATAGGTGIEWKMSVTDTARASNYPLKLKLAEFAAGSGTQVTVTCYFKKSHATDIVGKLVLPGNQPGGPAADTATTCPSDTTRNQLTVQFTPTAAGVFVIEAWAYWAANVADENVIIDDIAISQA